MSVQEEEYEGVPVWGFRASVLPDLYGVASDGATPGPDGHQSTVCQAGDVDVPDVSTR